MGIGGSFISIAAGTLFFHLSLDDFNQVWSPDKPLPVLAESSIHIIALSILGGYSGLRLIAALSNAGIKKLEQQIQDVKGQLEDQKSDVSLTKAKTLLDAEDTEEAIQILEKYTENRPNDPSGWSLLGCAYKRTSPPRLIDAINAAEKATQLNPCKWLYLYNLACYKSLYSRPSEEVIKLLETAVKLSPSSEWLIKEIKGEADFSNLKEDPSFINFIDGL